MSAQAVRALVKAETDRLRDEAVALQRSGDLSGAAEILYGRIPALEDGIARLERIDPVDLSARHRMITDWSGQTWVAFLLGDLDVPSASSPREDVERDGWMRVDEAFTLEERRRVILAQARRALLAGDRETANDLELGALADVEVRLAKQRCFELLSESDGRLLLRDGDGETWVAASLTEVTDG